MPAPSVRNGFWKSPHSRALPCGFAERTLLMGIVNATPDSFSDGGEAFSAGTRVRFTAEIETLDFESYGNVNVNAVLDGVKYRASGAYETQYETTMQTLKDLGFSSPYLLVMNKCDKIPSRAGLPQEAVYISAKTGAGLEVLKNRIFEMLRERFVRTELFIPYAQSARYGALRALLSEREVEYTDDGMRVQAVIHVEHAEKFRAFLKNKNNEK